MTLAVNMVSNILPLLLLLTFPSSQGKKVLPHIVLIMADDLGWYDVSFRDHEVYTPAIDKLAAEGVLFNYSYMMKSCTPSRSSLLTGLYAFRLGMQDISLWDNMNASLPLDKRVFPQDLQDKGYSTHFVGKWHLGYCKPEMTPTYRGFDTFYGKYIGQGDYYNHTTELGGYDMHDNKGRGSTRNFTVDWSANGTYSTELFTDKAVEIIKNHNDSQPLFLFLSYQAVHAPLQVPEHYITKYCGNVTVTYDNRKVHCGMTAAMDIGIGKVMAALKARGFDDNLVTLFTSDNGGPIKRGSSNWPLRGSKITEWEGGTRVVSILHSKKHLPKAPYTWNGIMHVVDWYPTLLRFAGIKVNTSQMDGIDNFKSIVKKKKKSKRTEFVYNLNDVKENYSLRWKKYKLASFKRANPNGWYNPPAGENATIPSIKKYPEYMLFDLEKDPLEKKDLGGKKAYKGVQKKMTTKLEAYKKDIQPFRLRDTLVDIDLDDYDGAWVTGWC